MDGRWMAKCERCDGADGDGEFGNREPTTTEMIPVGGVETRNGVDHDIRLESR
jgi:hypothetical protein